MSNVNLDTPELKELFNVITNKNLPETVRVAAFGELRQTQPHVLAEVKFSPEEEAAETVGAKNGNIKLQSGDEELMEKIRPILAKIQKDGREITNKGIVEEAKLGQDRMIPIAVGRVMSYLGYTHKRRGDRNNRRSVYINN